MTTTKPSSRQLSNSIHQCRPQDMVESFGRNKSDLVLRIMRFLFPNVDLIALVAPQLSYRSAMPHMEEVSHTNEEYGTYNPSFSCPDKPDVYIHQDLPSSQRPVPPRTASAFDTCFVPTQTVHSPVNCSNNASTPTKSSSSSPTLHPATEDESPTHMAQDAASPEENPVSPAGTSLGSTEVLLNTSPTPSSSTPPFTCPDSEATQTNANDDPADPVTSPSSQSSIPWSHTRIALAEIDKPFSKPRVKTPPYVPLRSSSLPRQASPVDTPPVTPDRRTSMTLSTEVDQTDRSEHPGGAADADSPPQDRRPSTNSANKTGDEDDSGSLAGDDAGKNSDELESDEEELLRVLARCNPIFITFSK